jgi:uncharacterized protein YegL
MPAKKKTTKQKTELVCILDRSGSMGSMAEEAIGGFNNFLEEQQKLPGIAKLTLCLFDNTYQLPYSGKDVKKVQPLNKDTYRPGGTTALLDAIGRTVRDVQTRLDKTPKNRKPDKVIMAILTDGYENASQDYTYDKISELLRKQREDNNWEIIYLAANQESFDVGQRMGIAGVGALNINLGGGPRGMSVGYNALTSSVTRSRHTCGQVYASNCSLDASDVAKWDTDDDQTDDGDDIEE